MSGNFFAPYFTPFVARRPIDVAPLNPHGLKMLLKPLEHRESGMASFFREPLCLPSKSEEQKQSLCCRHKENARSHHQHYLLLENLLISCKYLIINYNLSNEIAKGTNWEQKFQKLQNENICLTNLNMENKRNFPILSFEAFSQRSKKWFQKYSLPIVNIANIDCKMLKLSQFFVNLK